MFVERVSPKSTHRRKALLAGIGAAVLFVALTTYRLERTGAYYDELHQAAGAFAYVGRPTTMFSFVPVAGVPLMNMTYTGAIKTAVYGLYLRISGQPFSIRSWRLVGIIFSAAGLIAFAALAGGRLPPAALLLFLGLILTDTNVLLQSRHDWGPAALAFLLRMIFLGLAVRQLTGGSPRSGGFLLGLVAGFSIFEKLSSTVLIGPLVVILFADRRVRSVRAVAPAVAGLVVGALPVIAVNLYHLATTSRLFALSEMDPTPRRSLIGYLANYLVLGSGGIERRMMFDAPSFPWAERLEGLAICGLIALVGLAVWMRGRADGNARLAGVALLCYLAIGAALPFLPHGTAEHHWIIGTPFHYLAIAVAAAALWPQPASLRLRSGQIRALFGAGLALLLAARVPALSSTFDAIRGDKYTTTWDPSLTAAAVYAAEQPPSAIVIATNWGTGVQAFCFANGRQNFVFEPFTHYGGPETLNPIIDPPERQLVLAVAIRKPPRLPGEINTLKQVTEAIFADLASAPGWEEVPVDPSIRALRVVEIRAFRRTKRGGGL